MGVGVEGTAVHDGGGGRRVGGGGRKGSSCAAEPLAANLVKWSLAPQPLPLLITATTAAHYSHHHCSLRSRGGGLGP